MFLNLEKYEKHSVLETFVMQFKKCLDKNQSVHFWNGTKMRHKKRNKPK